VKRVQDGVHGLIEFVGRESLAVEILRTPELQRLRRVRQLGLASFVFPSAEHSRFAHAIGAAHLGSRFAGSLRRVTRELLAEGVQVDEEVSRDIVLAGLCHDVGHGPLSHAWERYVIGSYDFNEWKRALAVPDRPWLKPEMDWHELVTQACLLSEASGLRGYLEQVETGLGDRVAAILGDRYYLRYIARLLGSDVDIDRGDYILRDAIQTGVAYGRYDIDWLVSTLTIGFAGTKPVIGFDIAKGPRAVEQFLIARRALHDTVYFHKAVRSAEGMVGHLLELIQEEIRAGEWAPVSGFENFEAALGGPVELGIVLELDDDVLSIYLDRLAKDDSLKAAGGRKRAINEIARRIKDRDLLRPLQLSDAELEKFVRDPYRATEILDAEVGPHVSGMNPKDFILYSRVPFEFFEKGDKAGFFIDTRGSARTATPMREHPELFHHPRAEHILRTLYVPREAVEPLTKRIRDEQRAGGGAASADLEAAESILDQLLRRATATAV
jgi:HD superfamily phosphohydrolase